MTQGDGEGDTNPVAAALARVVRDFGPTVVYSPGRLRASLSDVLGSVGRLYRAEVDALEMAAEEGVARDIDVGSPDSAALAARLVGRGLTPEMARFAVTAWSGALTSGAVTPAAPVSAAALPPVADAASSRAPAATPWSGAAPPAASGPQTDEPQATVLRSSLRRVDETVAPSIQHPVPTSRGRRWWVLAVAAALLLAIAGGVLTQRARTPSDSSLDRMPTDRSKLSAAGASWHQEVPYGWEGSQCSTTLAAPTGVVAKPCALQLTVTNSGSATSWRITDVRVSGPGQARIIGDHDFVYENSSNGPYEGTVDYRIEGGGVQSIGRLTFVMACNTNFACQG